MIKTSVPGYRKVPPKKRATNPLLISQEIDHNKETNNTKTPRVHQSVAANNLSNFENFKSQSNDPAAVLS